MKNLILFSIILFLRCGTELGKGEFYKYTIRNESGKNITIKSYQLSFPSVEPLIFNIENGKELTKTYQDGLPPRSYDFSNFFGDINNQRDSIKVIYNNSKVSYLTGRRSSQNERNPLYRGVYHKTEEIFTFTQQDYENAEDCNGNCD